MADSTSRPAKSTVNDPSAIFEIWRTAQLVWRLMMDPRVPIATKVIVPVVALYVVSPIDLIPESFLLFFGLIDDLAVLFFGTKLFINLCPPDVVEEHRRALGMSTSSTSTDDNTVEGSYRVVDEDK